MQVSHSSPGVLPGRSKDRLDARGESEVVPEAVPEEDEADQSTNQGPESTHHTSDLPYKLPSLDIGSEDSHHEHAADDEQDGADTTPITDVQDDESKEEQPAVARMFSERVVPKLDLRGPASTEVDRANTLRKREELRAFLRQYVYTRLLL